MNVKKQFSVLQRRNLALLRKRTIKPSLDMPPLYRSQQRRAQNTALETYLNCAGVGRQFHGRLVQLSPELGAAGVREVQAHKYGLEIFVLDDGGVIPAFGPGAHWRGRTAKIPVTRDLFDSPWEILMKEAGTDSTRYSTDTWVLIATGM